MFECGLLCRKQRCSNERIVIIRLLENSFIDTRECLTENGKHDIGEKIPGEDRDDRESVRTEDIETEFTRSLVIEGLSLLHASWHKYFNG